MANFNMLLTVSLLAFTTFITLESPEFTQEASGKPPMPPSSGTFGTIGGYFGYWNLYSQGYGVNTAALITAVFNNGLSCRACFEIKCSNDPQWCHFGRPLNLLHCRKLCTPNYALLSDNGGGPDGRGGGNMENREVEVFGEEGFESGFEGVEESTIVIDEMEEGSIEVWFDVVGEERA